MWAMNIKKKKRREIFKGVRIMELAAMEVIDG